jgi:hypothetical protein
MLRLVRAIRQPSSPPASAPPPPVVLIEVVSITLGIADETVESFGQARQDALCSTIVAAPGDPTAECRVTSVVPKGDGGGGRVMQAGGGGGSGIDVDTSTTFVTVVTDTSGGGGGSTGGSTGGRRGPDAGAIRAGAIRAGAIRAGAIRAGAIRADSQPHAQPDDIKCWNAHGNVLAQPRAADDQHRYRVDAGHAERSGRHRPVVRSRMRDAWDLVPVQPDVRHQQACGIDDDDDDDADDDDADDDDADDDDADDGAGLDSRGVVRLLRHRQELGR